MTNEQWLCVGLCFATFFAVLICQIVGAKRDVELEENQGDIDFPPLDYRQYRKI